MVNGLIPEPPPLDHFTLKDGSTIRCFRHQLDPDVRCGHTYSDPDWDSYVKNMSSTFKAFQAGTLEQFFETV